MINVTRFYLFVSALAFLWIGVNTMLDPRAALAPLDLVPQTNAALNEVRANYGAMQFAIGLLLVLGTLRERWRLTAIVTNVTLCAGLALGRLGSLWLDGMPNDFVFMLLAVEVTVSLIGAVLIALHLRSI